MERTETDDAKSESRLTAVVPCEPSFRDLQKSHADFHVRNFQKNRRLLLSELRCMSGVPEIARTLDPDTLYRVVVPEGELLQQGKDGLFRGVFYGDRGIDQHAKFVKVGPNLLDAARAVGSQVLLISIAMQLNRIQSMVEGLLREMHRDRIAEILSGVDQFETAMLFQDSSKRNLLLTNAIQTLCTGLHKTTAELRVRIAEAPDPANSVLDHLAPWKNKTEMAAQTMGLAQDSFSAVLLGIKTLAECYAILGEPEAASKVLTDHFRMVMECEIHTAAEKARLVEVSGSHLPQEPWERFIEEDRKMRENILPFRRDTMGKRKSRIAIEFMPHDLKGDDRDYLP